MASLVADYGSDSESEDSDSNVSAKSSKNDAVEKIMLPKPDFVVNSSSTSWVKNSVFSNPYREAEDSKSAILEKHVKMIPSKAEIKAINGKSICWMYRKGRCRFGHNCKFAHDSDVELSSVSEAGEIGDKAVSQVVPDESSVGEPLGEDDTIMTSIKRKRPGLSQTLTPGKKVMKMYNQQKWKK
ncbi:unnamed protein product [Bemisia tabaci]|uniref:C3H1-type domain-containing protein n=1 Tax=Bemisia tabaci TaxID=7038 RepID=A0A9P0A1L4_BEMTA|nr:unnamed protein product [Bemisia tabaci]